MAKVYYRKELVTNAFYVNGLPAPFEHIGNNQGILELDTEKDGELIAGLDKAANEHRGGILKISESEYTEKKTMGSLTPSTTLPKRSETLRVMQSPFQRKAPAAKPADNPEPLLAHNPPAPPVPPAQQMQETLSALTPTEEKPLPTFKPATGKAKATPVEKSPVPS